MYAFGIGSVVDLPKISVIVMGLDEWEETRGQTIQEERLLRAVRRELGPQVQQLLGPPVGDGQSFGLALRLGEPPIGVPVATFPRWLVCPLCRLLAPLSSDLFRLDYNRYRPDRTAYYHDNCPKSPGRKGLPAIPARWLMACKRGHLDDFPWMTFVHGGPTDCQGLLRIQEYGVSGEASAVHVQCETCGKTQSMAAAFEERGRVAMPLCRGRRPHLRDYEECGDVMEPSLLGASDGWFPLTVTALAIPTESGALQQLVADNWMTLEKATNAGLVTTFRQIGVLRAFAAYSDEDIWQAIETRRAADPGGEEGPEDIRSPEWQVLSHPNGAGDAPDFRLRPVPPPPAYASQIEEVVLAERLREVQAFVGFTRIEAPADWTDPEGSEGATTAAISRRPPAWVPAAEVRGEGIFLRFREDAIEAWERSLPVRRLEGLFRMAHTRWCHVRGREDSDAGFPGIRYVLLHSFSHALMRQLALECGYSAASIKERLYARPPGEGEEAMAGILLYTAAPDSEGTLGGLVRLGEPEYLERHITQALELVRLCASDPLCSEHRVEEGNTTLHGAACHACLFVPETSCEHGNRYLDRATLVPTYTRGDVALFSGEEVLERYAAGT
jgi:hypothetical protein